MFEQGHNRSKRREGYRLLFMPWLRATEAVAVLVAYSGAAFLVAAFLFSGAILFFVALIVVMIAFAIGAALYHK